MQHEESEPESTRELFEKLTAELERIRALVDFCEHSSKQATGGRDD